MTYILLRVSKTLSVRYLYVNYSWNKDNSMESKKWGFENDFRSRYRTEKVFPKYTMIMIQLSSNINIYHSHLTTTS